MMAMSTFTVPEGDAYLIIANRDSYSGMYSGIAEKGPAVQVATTRLSDKQTIVAGKLKDSQGNMLDEVTVTVTDKTTGAKTTSQFKNGLLGFVGIEGHTYTIAVEDKNHRTQSQDVTILPMLALNKTLTLFLATRKLLLPENSRTARDSCSAK